MEEHTDEHLSTVVASVKEMLENFELSERNKPLTTSRWPVPKISGQYLYVPCKVYIGPLGSDRWLHEDMKHHKCRLLKSFLCRNPHLCVDDYIRALQSLDARQYYEDLNEDPEYYTRQFLLDGCFILELFLKWLEEYPDVLFKEHRGQTNILYDLLLVDNQIPFVVIEKLYNLLMAVPGPTSGTRDGSSGTNLAMAVQEPTSTRDVFLNHLARFLMAEELPHISPSPVPFPETIHDLLDLYHKFLMATTSLCKDGENYQTTVSPLWKQRLTPSITLRAIQRDANRPQRRIPCATELYKAAGIKFKKKQSPKNFLDVKFRRGRGTLEIPPLQVDKNTKALLVNLVTLEARKTRKEQIVTSYVVLIDSLIDTKGDVELLQRNGVIRNMLSSHHDAAIFFNELGGSLSYDTVNHHFANLFEKVHLYYESKSNQSWARLMLDYLRNPWAIISVIAGVILLGMSMLQTIYTVFPYYHPRH